MLFFSSLLTLSLLAVTAVDAATPLRAIEKFYGDTSGRYIVKLRDGASKTSLLAGIKSAKVTHDWKVINGFAGDLDDAVLAAFRASLDVEYVAEDGILHALTTQTNAPWSLARISSTAKLSSTSTDSLTFSYTYGASAGSGVDIYRCGTAAGSQFGVAKGARIIAVKVLSDAGSGSVSDIVSGLKTNAASTGRPSIASLSLGGSASTAFDNAVTALTAAGIHVTVAAGNSNVDADSTSPARAAAAVTVGANTIADARASFSNYGSVVDIFAPGQNVISSWIGSTTATNNISGTSMATPHVAGIIAYLINLQGNDTPTAISNKLKTLAVKNTLTGIPSGTANNLAHNT